MLRVKKVMSVVTLSLLSATSFAQTIDELTDAARAAKLKTLQGNGPAAGVPLSFPMNGGSPLALNTPSAPAEIPPVRKRRSEIEPYLLSIYGVGSRLITEIAEDGSAAKYRPGDKTPSGWTVAAIAKSSVDLHKLNKQGKVISRKTLAFWRELDDGSHTSGTTDAFNRHSGPVPPIQPPFPPTMAGR